MLGAAHISFLIADQPQWRRPDNAQGQGIVSVRPPLELVQVECPEVRLHFKITPMELREVPSMAMAVAPPHPPVPDVVQVAEVVH